MHVTSTRPAVAPSPSVRPIQTRLPEHWPESPIEMLSYAKLLGYKEPKAPTPAQTRSTADAPVWKSSTEEARLYALLVGSKESSTPPAAKSVAFQTQLPQNWPVSPLEMLSFAKLLGYREPKPKTPAIVEPRPKLDASTWKSSPEEARAYAVLVLGKAATL